MDEAKYCDESESSYDMVDAVESVGMSRNALFSSSERTTECTPLSAMNLVVILTFPQSFLPSPAADRE